MRSALEGLDGVKSATVSLDKDNAVVVYDSEKVTTDQMKQAIKQAGYGVSAVSAVKPHETTPSEGQDDAASEGQAAPYRTLTIDELAKLTDDPDVYLVNVHIPYAGEIPGTDAFIPFNRIEENRKKLPDDRHAEIVLYCRSGNMSKSSYTTLKQMGYTNLYDVPGGMNAWRQAGNELKNRKE